MLPYKLTPPSNCGTLIYMPSLSFKARRAKLFILIIIK
nr:MAG TPA: hypothetical protein [Caudoviricetes sp.]